MSREETIYEIIRLVRANQVLTDLLDERASEYLGINRTDARALDVIDQKGRITAGELARELRMSTGAVTTVVDRLERAGYARRIPDTEDRRRVLIEITPVVQKSAEKIYGAFDDVVPRYADYSDRELELVLRFQEFGRQWLEEALARADEVAKRPLKPASPEGRGAKRSARSRRRPS